MKHIVGISIIAGLLIVLFSCKNETSESRPDRIAKNICQCSTSLLDLNKAAAVIDTGAIDFEGIQTAFEKTKACIANQHVKAEDLPEVRKSLAIKCPELAAETELLTELLGR
jgi:hypothetical protein